MTRSINPVPQWAVGGVPVALGEMYFFETGTDKPKATFADSDETIFNTHPVILDGDGNLPNVFFTGVAKQLLTQPSLFTQGDGRGVQVFSRDPVGQQSALSAFDIYSETTIYQLNSLVTTSDGSFWKSLGNDNVGNSPISDDGSNWQQIDFEEFYAQSVTFSELDSVISVVDGLTYISVVDNNLGNEPSVDDGTNWVLDNPTLEWVIGKTYFVGERANSTVDNRTYKAILSQAGNEPSVDDGTNWLPTDGVVTTPVNVLPADSATDVSKTPLLTIEAYEITGSDNEQEWVQHQLSADSFSTVVYDSGITRDFDGHTVTEPLDSATVYGHRALLKGVRTDVTDFSTETTFTTVPDLAEVFAINSDIGSGAARTTVTNVDLSTQSGSVWTFNRDIVSFVKKMDTVRGFNEFDFTNNTAQAANAQGLTSYLVNGFNVGTDADYNGSTNTISSFTFQNKVGFHDTVQYTGNSSTRTISHALGVEVGAIIIKSTGSINDFILYNKDIAAVNDVGFQMQDGLGNVLDVFSLATTSAFGLTDDPNNVVNDDGVQYIAELFAHNPDQGIFCGSYTGTNSAGLKIVTGFPVGLFIVYSLGVGAVDGTLIADIKSGTSSHILASATGNTEQIGSVASFDSDGVTLTTNDFNNFNTTNLFIAIADPAQF